MHRSDDHQQEQGMTAAQGPLRQPRGTRRLAAACFLALLPLGCTGAGSSASNAVQRDAGGDQATGPCAPLTCATAQAECGGTPDGCGAVIQCGACNSGETCGAAGPNRCGVGSCTPESCQEQQAECGTVSDQCGDVLDCGQCPALHSCWQNRCEPNGVGGSGQGGSGQGGSGQGGSGQGGSGGTSCPPSDYCAQNGYTSGWHCDGPSVTYRCGLAGGCPAVIDEETCVSGCSSGACLDNCTTLCSGHCGSYQGCSCGACSGADVCVSNTCQACADGDTQSKYCDPGMYCPPGESVSQCVNGAWGPWGPCAAGASDYRYYGDGGTHCGAVVCLQIAPTGSNSGVTATLSKINSMVFDNNVTLTVYAYGVSPISLGCVGTKGLASYSFSIAGTSLGMALGDTTIISASAVSPCGTGTDHVTDDAFASRCKP